MAGTYDEEQQRLIDRIICIAFKEQKMLALPSLTVNGPLKNFIPQRNGLVSGGQNHH